MDVSNLQHRASILLESLTTSTEEGDPVRRSAHSFLLIILGVALLVQGCDIYDEDTYFAYDITIVNDTRLNFAVYLDDAYQFKLSPGESATIKDVKEGDHTLQAVVSGFVVAERTLNLNQDTEWTVSG